MASQSIQVVPSSVATAPTTAGPSSSASVVGNTSCSSSITTIPVTVTSSIVDELVEENYNDDGLPQSDPTRWFFSKEQLENTPSRRAGVKPDVELTFRQQSANFIQDIGQRLQVNQLCINTAIVYMHRFYMFHSFTVYNRNSISTAAVFLAAKVEEQPRKLEYVIKVAHYCLFRESQPQIDLKSEAYANLASDLVSNENILLQTLGFDVAIDHPHTHVVKCCQLVRASKDLAQTSYFMATNSLHLTTMCLEYKSSVVACVCIHLACKWSNWEIPRSKEGKDWFWYVDGTVTIEQLEQYTNEFLTIFNKSPSRLKKKIISLSAATRGNSGNLSAFPSHFNLDPSSPGMPQFSKSRSPSPSESANAGKLRLPPKSNAPQPLFSQVRPMVKPGVVVPGQPHPANKPPNAVSGSSSGHPHVAPPPPIYRQNAHVGPAHPGPVKTGHPYPPGPHPGAVHGDTKNLQKQATQFPPGYHPASSGMVQNSHPPGSSRPQPVHQNNTQGHLPSSSHLPTGPKPGLHPPAVQGANNTQHGINVMNTQNQRQPLTGPQQPRPHNLVPRPNAPPPPTIRPLMGQSQGLKRPYPTDLQPRPEGRPEMMAKPIISAPRFPPPQNHVVGSSQGQVRPVNVMRPRIPDKPDIRHPMSQPMVGPPLTHQAPQMVTQANHGVAPKLPAAVDGRPWMDRFLDNEIHVSRSEPPPKPPMVAPKPPQLSQLHVSSSGLSSMQQQSVHSGLSGSSFHVSSTSSAVPAVATSMSPPTLASTLSLMPIPPNALTLTLTPTTSLASSSISSDSVGSEKRKKEKKHKKDKHRDKEEKEHKHKHKEKHKKEHKEKHKDKHKSKHRPTEDFSIDAGGNKLKIIIGRNPNATAAQDSKDSNSKSSKHSKDHHTATIINY